MSLLTEKKYLYRKHLRHPFKLMLGILVGYLVVFAYSALIISSKDPISLKVDFLTGLISLIPGYIIVTSIIFCIFYFALLRNFKNTHVELKEDGLAYVNGKKDLYIPYTDITALKFPSIKYTGGWVKFEYGKKSVRLTVTLENIGDFVKELKDKLDLLDKSNIYNEKKLFNFYKTATYSDQSWERVYEKFPLFLKLTPVNMLITFLVSLKLPSNDNSFTLSIFALLLFPIVYIIVELILGIIIAKRSKLEGFNISERNIDLENKIYTIVCFITIALEVIIFGSLFF